MSIVTPPLWRVVATVGSYLLFDMTGPAAEVFDAAGRTLARVDADNDPRVLGSWHRDVVVKVEPR